MICPNCKTELVEVNGRYICSDCGREIPENEVMASDWGNGGNTRAGLYGAGTDDLPEEGSKPISDYGASLSEAENEITPATAVVTDSPAEVPATPVAQEELTVEEILQEQATEAKPDPGFYTPPVDIEPAAAVLPAEPEPMSETAPVPPVVPAESYVPVSEPEPAPVPDIVLPVAPVENVVPEAVPVADDVQPVPITTPEVIAPIAPPVDTIAEPVLAETVPEIVPEHEQVVTDMFESAYTPPVTNDPGIYRDPMYEAVGTDSPVAENVGGSVRAPMPADKKTTMLVLISGIALTLLLIIGGIWAYVSLNAKVVPVVTPVVDEVTWQELQVVDGKFKLSFPGTPEKTEEKIQINGMEQDAIVYSSTVDNSVYLLKYAFLPVIDGIDLSGGFSATAPLLVTKMADSLGLSVSSTKIGKYYQADAIDFVVSDDSSEYRGKIMVLGNRYIVVSTGSDSGQSADYDKFIKSFSFITTEAAE